MAKERAPKNHPISLKTGHLQHPSYFVPEKARSTTRRSRANSSAVRPAAPAKEMQRTQRIKSGRKRLRESRKKKTQRA